MHNVTILLAREVRDSVPQSNESHSMRSLRILAAVTPLLMVAAPAVASSDYLLQLDPVKGEGVANAAPQTIEVDSFSWGASNPAVASARGGSGKVNMQDLSVASAVATRDAASGMATGKQAMPVAEAAAVPGTAVNGPKVGDVASFTVMVRESPTKSSTRKGGGCGSGTHFTNAVLVVQGKRYELSDVVMTSCTVGDGAMKKEFKGHVTLLK